jgi:LysM repeat protein
MGISNYVIHKVTPNDTLDRISIIYNVPKDAIRKANQFTGDEIYMKKELIIPNSNGPVFKTESQPV